MPSARDHGPAPARHQLPCVTRVGATVRVGDFSLCEPQHFLCSRVVSTHCLLTARIVELLFRAPPRRHHVGRTSAVAGSGDAAEGVASVALFDDGARRPLRGPRWRETRTTRAEPIPVSSIIPGARGGTRAAGEPGLSPEPIQRGRLLIYKSPLVDSSAQIRAKPGRCRASCILSVVGVRGKSLLRSRDNARSASTLPPFWQIAVKLHSFVA